MRQKARFVSPRSSKIMVTKEKERRKGKSEEKERKRRKERMVALLVFTIATLKVVFVRKSRLMQKVYLAMTLSKIRLDIYRSQITLTYSKSSLFFARNISDVRRCASHYYRCESREATYSRAQEEKVHRQIEVHHE